MNRQIMNSYKSSRPALTSMALIALLVTIGLEISYYPRISSWVFETAAGHGWDGSGLNYYQMFYILPGGLVVAAVLTTYVLWTLKRRPASSATALVTAWVANLATFGFSILWYANQPFAH